MHASAIVCLSGFTVDAMKEGESLAEFLKRLCRKHPEMTDVEFLQRYFCPLKITTVPLGTSPHREPKEYDIDLDNGATVSPFSRDGAAKWDKQASELHQRYGVPMPIGRDKGNTFFFVSPVPQSWIDGDTKALLELEEAQIEPEADEPAPTADIFVPPSNILNEPASTILDEQPTAEVAVQVVVEGDPVILIDAAPAVDPDQAPVLEQLQAQLAEAPEPELVAATPAPTKTGLKLPWS